MHSSYAVNLFTAAVSSLSCKALTMSCDLYVPPVGCKAHHAQHRCAQHVADKPRHDPQSTEWQESYSL